MNELLDRLSPEERARVRIDRMLAEAGWVVQDAGKANLRAARGVAIREFILKRSHGRADYLLFVDERALGVIEAKPEGTPLTGVEWQSAKYVEGLPDDIPAHMRPLRFAYESTGTETRFTNGFDPDAASRGVFWFHRPETLANWVAAAAETPERPTLRARLRQMPALDLGELWPPKDVAMANLEASLARNRPRALIQMATGSGKTLLAAYATYRLVKFARARRILFLVDRANLGRQALREFQSFVLPDTQRKFTDEYIVQHLTSNVVDATANVIITTIQRLYSILKGDEELDPELDERSSYELPPSAPIPVTYNTKLPFEFLDAVIVDECHRSIYGLWRQVLDYFDAFVIGLTATPNKQAAGFFNQNIVMEYPHEQAVADGINVDFWVYRIKTEVTERGGKVEAGLVTGFRDRQTRRVRWEELDEDITYDPQDLDRSVVAKDQIRTVIRTFHDRLFTEIFPDRSEVPKTLIFAKDDSHADDIVQIAREEFGKGNEFVVKITYRSGALGQKPEDLLASFRNSYLPRIVVTVDMIATGTDVKPIECVIFMRSVRSRPYFEQMKGRGVRVISPTDLQAVTPDARVKDHFVIVDAVGLTEHGLVDSPPLDRQPTIGLDRLLRQLSYGNRDPAIVSSVASRLARLDRRLTKEDRQELLDLAGGISLADLALGIVDALDPDGQYAAAQAATGKEDPTAEDLHRAAAASLDRAVEPLSTNPELRQKILDVKHSYEQVIDETTIDLLQHAGYAKDAAGQAQKVTQSFRQFIEDHKDEITALQILYSRPYAQRLMFKEVKELAHAISRPPNAWTPERLWKAYVTLDKSKVRGSGPKTLTDIVSIVRFALQQDDQLVPFADQVGERFEAWLLQQEHSGRAFTSEQRAWLERIRDHIAASMGITVDDFEYVPFVEHGGLGKAYDVFGQGLGSLLEELTGALVA